MTPTTRTSAVTMREYGPPEVLTFSPAALPPLREDEVRITTLAAAEAHRLLEAGGLAGRVLLVPAAGGTAS